MLPRSSASLTCQVTRLIRVMPDAIIARTACSTRRLKLLRSCLHRVFLGCWPTLLIYDYNLRMNDEKFNAMANENTPLIQRVHVRPHRDRYPHHRLRFICTSLLSATVLIGGIVAIIIFSFAPAEKQETPSQPGALLAASAASRVPEGWRSKTEFLFEDLQGILLETPDTAKTAEWSRYYTSGPHLAGKNLSQALWTRERWEEFGIASSIVDYEVYINYPKGHRLALLEQSKHEADVTERTAEGKDVWEVKYEAILEEDVLEEDKASQLQERIPTFHGYSASGNVTAPYVFVNYGTYQDFEDLRAANISLQGKIALAKYGGVFRGLKVKRAQEMGMIGVVIYTDPGDDGELTEKNGYEAYPSGPARQPSSVQRGSVQYLSMSSNQHFCSNTLTLERLCARRPNHARLPLEARLSAPIDRACHAADSLPPHLVPRRSPSTQSAQRTWPKGKLVQQ